MNKNRLLTTVLGTMLLVGGIGLAQRKEPVRNVSEGRHPNIAEAQRLSREAFDKITAAQQANEWDLKGHDKKAKALLEQVNNELKLAAEAANAR